MSLLNRLFKLDQFNVSVKSEALAGLTTFVTIAYLQILEPSMLHQMGEPYDLAFFAISAVVLIGCFLCAFIANLPFAVAPGLGLLTYANYVVVQQLHHTWQQVLGVVTLTGLIFFILTVLGLRRMVIRAIPQSMGYAIAAGIGFFIGFIALRQAGIVVANAHSLVSFGSIRNSQSILFLLGFVLIIVLDQRRFPGAILIGMLVITVVAWLTGQASIAHVMALPPKPATAWTHIDFSPWFHWQAFPVVFTFILVAMFDSTGTIVGLSKLLNRKDQGLMSQVQRALLAESATTGISGLVGATTASPLIESSSGIRAGGRTGLTSVVVALLFSLLLFFSPLAQNIPVAATSAALFYVACMMVQSIAHIGWEELTESIPAVIVLIAIPLTFSIANGVGLGLICYALIKLLTGGWRDCHLFLWVLTLCFILYFIILPT